MKKPKTLLMEINDTAKLFKNHLRIIADEHNLSACYRPIICYLSHYEKLTQCELVNLTHFKAPTISLTLQKMEQDGYVKRTPAVDDARKIYVSLTSKGVEYNELMIKLVTKDEELILSCLTEEEIKQLEGILTKLKNKMSQEFGELKDENI